jgi:hypothetical protein
MSKIFEFILQRSTEKTFVIGIMLLILWKVLPIFLPTTLIIVLTVYILAFATDNTVDIYTTKVVNYLKSLF